MITIKKIKDKKENRIRSSGWTFLDIRCWSCLSFCFCSFYFIFFHLSSLYLLLSFILPVADAASAVAGVVGFVCGVAQAGAAKFAATVVLARAFVVPAVVKVVVGVKFVVARKRWKNMEKDRERVRKRRKRKRGEMWGFRTEAAKFALAVVPARAFVVPVVVKFIVGVKLVARKRWKDGKMEKDRERVRKRRKRKKRGGKRGEM